MEIYNFKQLEAAFIGFIANFEKKVNDIFPNIPVMMENVDDGYFLFQKYSKSQYQELYHKVPRISLVFNDISAQTDQTTSQFIKLKYRLNNQEVESQFRHITTRISIDCKLVASNYLKALQYWEFLSSILFFDNAFTYKFNDNTYQGAYWTDSGPQIEKTALSMGTGESRNVIVNCNITLSLRPTILNPFNLQLTNGNNGIDSLTDYFLIDDKILTNPSTNTPNGYAVGKDDSGKPVLINSNPNSQSGFNDISVSKEDEYQMIGDNSNILKRANNVFNIFQKKCDKDTPKSKDTYHTTLKPTVETYKKPEE